MLTMYSTVHCDTTVTSTINFDLDDSSQTMRIRGRLEYYIKCFSGLGQSLKEIIMRTRNLKEVT